MGIGLIISRYPKLNLGRWAVEVKEDGARCVIKAMGEDGGPKVPARDHVHSGHNQPDYAGHKCTEKTLVGMGSAEQHALKDAGGNPAGAAPAKQHGQSVKEETTEHK